MTTLANKFIELFKNLKPDAVPNAPRPNNERTDSPRMSETTPPNVESTEGNVYEQADFEEDEIEKEKKSSDFKFNFKSKKHKDKKGGAPKKEKQHMKHSEGHINSVNTQATGAVFNVLNSKDVQFGSNHVYYMSSDKKTHKETDDEEHIEKDNLITLLMESHIEPTHKYIDFVSKNLGVNWKSFFLSLGYLKGRIETLVLEHGITEARYQLLLDWVNNEDNPSIGRLATLLWDDGERQIVKELSLIYNENKK